MIPKPIDPGSYNGQTVCDDTGCWTWFAFVTNPGGYWVWVESKKEPIGPGPGAPGVYLGDWSSGRSNHLFGALLGNIFVKPYPGAGGGIGSILGRRGPGQPPRNDRDPAPQDPVGDLPYDIKIEGCDKKMLEFIKNALEQIQQKLRNNSMYINRFRGCSTKLDKLIECILAKANSLGTIKKIICKHPLEISGWAGSMSKDNTKLSLDPIEIEKSGGLLQQQQATTGTIFHEMLHSCDDGKDFKNEVWEQNAKFLTIPFFGNDKFFGLNKGAFQTMAAQNMLYFHPGQPWNGIIESSFFIWDTTTGKVRCKDSGKEIDIVGDGKPLLPEPGWI